MSRIFLSDTPRVEIRDIRKAWRGRVVLDGVDLVARRGERIVITGENGAGKTTILRIICGLIRADSGDVRIMDLTLPHDWDRARSFIGYLPAGNSNLYNRLTVRQHLELWARIGFLPRRQRRERIDWALETLELSPIASQRADRISTGQRQRTRIASTLLAQPDIILMDEPTLSLDESGREAFDVAIGDCLRSGCTLIICQPAGGGDELVADQRLVLADGRLHASGREERRGDVALS